MRPPAAAPPRRPGQLLTGVKISLLVLVALVVPITVVFAFMHSLPDSRGGEFRTHGAAGGSSLGSQPGRPMFGGSGGGGLGVGGLGSMLSGGADGKEQQGQQQRHGGELVPSCLVNAVPCADAPRNRLLCFLMQGCCCI